MRLSFWFLHEPFTKLISNSRLMHFQVSMWLLSSWSNLGIEINSVFTGSLVCESFKQVKLCYNFFYHNHEKRKTKKLCLLFVNIWWIGSNFDRNLLNLCIKLLQITNVSMNRLYYKMSLKELNAYEGFLLNQIKKSNIICNYA